MPQNANIIERNVAKFRYQAGWTQEFLAARMQLLGCYINRDIIANIETHRTTVTDKRIAFFAMVSRVPLHCLFLAGLTLNWPVDQQLKYSNANSRHQRPASVDSKMEDLVKIVGEKKPRFTLIAGDLLPKTGGYSAQKRFFSELKTYCRQMKRSASATVLTYFGNDDFHILEPLLDEPPIIGARTGR